jgi:CheY-like chemotaxis protein/predicted regulator of Ras-like GTPase activity (Roadblock/LC7/MglB family)
VPGIERYDLVVETMAKQWRILVVEEEEKLNWNIVSSLQRDGYIVLGVTGGAEAIRTLWDEDYDVVICSQHMADAEGFDLLQWLRTYCPDTRMVMLGEPESGVGRVQALEMGVASYLEKPLDIQVLREELRRMLYQTGFSASLDSFDLLDVIQIITMSRKNIALVVNTGLEEQGMLCFQMGELIWAEYGTLRGEEAFFALAAHKNGTVVHRPWNDQITPNVTQPLSRLIFQALQYRSKYAEQASGKMEAVESSGAASSNGTMLSPVPSTTMPEALQNLDNEEDDSPFQFVEEESPVEAQVPAGSLPGFQISESMRAVTEGSAEISVSSGPSNIPPTVQKAAASQNNALPSWLTDQPTHSDLPVLRGNTGQMPRTPQARTPAFPQTPSTSTPSSPDQSAAPQGVSAEWPELPPPPPPVLKPSDSGLRRIKTEEAMLTNPRHATVRPDGSQPSGPLRPTPAEWQSPMPASLSSMTGPMSPVKPQKASGQTGSILKSLSALRKNSATPVPDARPTAASAQPPGGTDKRTWAPPVTETPGKRNYSALAAALQTLGYSVAGFIACAIVGMDGMPIAQVAVDDMDISPLCKHFGGIVRTALLAMEQGRGEIYEHTVITSRTRHILLRLLNTKDMFQVLITTHETTPAQSLEIMASVEPAIEAAL